MLRPAPTGPAGVLRSVGRVLRPLIATGLACILLGGVAASAFAQTAPATAQITPPVDRIKALTLIPEPPIPPAVIRPWFTYTVRQGDSLWHIAQRYGIDLATMEYANGLDQASILRPGQKLRVLLHDGYLYQVQDGDTLAGIAAAHHVTLTALLAANHLSAGATVPAGSELIIPKDPKVKLVVPPATSRALAKTAQALAAPPRQSLGASALAWAVAHAAEALIGHPYVWGGFGPFVFDCSGLVMYVYRLIAGIRLPHSSRAQMGYGRPVPEWALRPGDLVFFDTNGPGASHVGIYIGGSDRDFVSAETPGLGVGVGSLKMAYWADHFVGARQILGG